MLDERLDSIIPFAELCTFPPPAQEFWLMSGYQMERNGEKVIIHSPTDALDAGRELVRGTGG